MRHVDWGPQRPQNFDTPDGSNIRRNGNETDLDGSSGGQRQPPTKDVSPRITINVHGLEWFVFNRSPVYEGILAAMMTSPPNEQPVADEALPLSQEEPQVAEGGERQSSMFRDSAVTKEAFERASSNSSSPPLRTTSERGDGSYDLPSLIRLLPVGIQCKKGAMVMGNEYTQSVLVAKFNLARGFVNAGASGPQDIYKQSFDFDLEDFTASFRKNQDYVETPLSAGSHVDPAHNTDQPRRPSFRESSKREFRKIVLKKLYLLVPRPKEPVKSVLGETSIHGDNAHDSHPAAHNKWLGLSRYLDESDDEHVEQERWKGVEYAQIDPVVECPKLSMSFFWDVPGKVPAHHSSLPNSSNALKQNINGSTPPDWGLNVILGGGLLNYGPWADRQRADLQAFFFPQTFTDARTSRPLQPGQLRQSTQFKIDIILDDSVVVRIHTREESKDWKFKGFLTRDIESQNKSERKGHRQKKHGKENSNADIRPAGWLDLTVAANTCVSYSMDMVSGPSGFENILSVDVPSLHISTSVNHGLLLRSRNLLLGCDLSAPVKWNDQRSWSFDIDWIALELFLLRDHAFLFMDLINDWTTGPLQEYLTFIPFLYSLRLQLPFFKIYLNINDSNIIDSPSALDANAFMVFGGESLNADLKIPMIEFRPLHNEISFNADVSNMYLELLTPTWNTLHSLLSDKKVATLDALTAVGSYTYYTSTSSAQTETLTLDLHGLAPTVQLFGFLIRYFLVFRENYFGEDMHFQTLEEHQQKLGLAGHPQSTQKESRHVRPSNDLDVILTIAAEDACIELPSELYSAQNNVNVAVSSVNIDLRFTNYYMDIEIQSSPLALTRGSFNPQGSSLDSVESNTQVFVDGITVSGHRLFGLPPTEPTYVCNWDISVGSVTGECSIEFMALLISAGKVIAFQVKDTENALPPIHPPQVHDITFLRAGVESLRVWVHIRSSALLLESDCIHLVFNDWAKQSFSDCMYAKVPHILLSIMDAEAASRQRTKSRIDTATYGAFRTSLELRLAKSKANFRERRQLQQDYVELHDSRTRRTPWLLPVSLNGLARSDAHPKTHPPAMPVPFVPQPLHPRGDSAAKSLQYLDQAAPRLKLRHSSSFLTDDSDLMDIPDYIPSSRIHVNDSISMTTSSSRNARSRKAANPDSVSQDYYSMPANVAFSSPFHTPYFPLQSVVPDLSVLPTRSLQVNGSDADDEQSIEDTWETPEDDIVRTSIILSFGSTMQVFCTPSAVSTLSNIVQSLQPNAPAQILDDIQMASMATVIGRMSNQDPSSRLQMHLTLPAVDMKFSKEVEHSPLCHIYELLAAGIQGTVGYGPSKHTEASSETSRPLSVRLVLTQVTLSAKAQKQGLLNDEAKLDLSLDRATCWLSQDTRISSQVRLKGFQILSSNRKVEHLTDLSNGTVVLFSDLHKQLSRLPTVHQRNRQTLVYNLLSRCGDSSDPVFLSTVSYIVRAASNHPRTSDTWKMMSRLRFVYDNLSLLEKAAIKSECPNPPSQLLQDEIEKVVSAFNKWRAWDLVQVKSSAFIQELYPSATSTSPIYSSTTNLEIGLNIDSFNMLIDPGPEQHEIKVNHFLASLQSSLESTRSAREEGRLKRNSTVAVLSDQVVVHLNWGICDLLEGVLNHLDVTAIRQASDSASQQSSTSNSPISDKLQHSIHGLLSLEYFDLGFKSINLMATSLSQSIKGSLLLNQIPGGEASVNAIINAQYIATKVSSQLRSLALVQIVYPSLHGSFGIRETAERQKRSWSGGAFCSKIGIEVHENVLGLLGVADVVLKDEYAYLVKMKPLIASRPTSSLTKSDTPSGKSFTNTFVVSLLLDDYSISIALLASLRYVVRGNTARSTLRSIHDSGPGLVADVDIKKHYHSLENHLDQSTQEIAGFTLPPLNGHLIFTQGDEFKSVTVSIALEKISMDASALHSILTTVSRDEISHFRRDFARDLAIVKSNLQGTLGDHLHTSPTSAPQAAKFIYRANLAASGLEIIATTGKSSPHAARLLFQLSGLGFRIDNGEKRTRREIVFPEVKANIGEIKVMLERYDGRFSKPCGDVTLKISMKGTSKSNEEGITVRSIEASVIGPEINLFPDTAPTIVDILGHIQQKFKTFNLTQEIHTLRARRHRSKSQAKLHSSHPSAKDEQSELTTVLFNSLYSLEVRNVQVSWRVGDLVPISPGHEVEDLVFSIELIHLSTRTTSAARLVIANLQLQMLPSSQSSRTRSDNSALMPEIVFNAAYLSTSKDRRLAFQAVGKSVDLRLTPHFVLPASDLQRSIGRATEDLRKVIAGWNASLLQDEQQNKKLFGNKKLSSVLVDADFAGAVVYLQKMGGAKTPISVHSPQQAFQSFSPQENPLHSPKDAGYSAVLRTPGIALKVQYQDLGDEDPSLNAEIRVDASSNTLQPTIVPLILELTSSVQEIVHEKAEGPRTPITKSSPVKTFVEDPVSSAYPVAILGSCKLNLGLRICQQRFGLTCQPIAKVAAVAEFEDIYITINTVQSAEQGRFFALSARVVRLQASVQHAYSQEPTGSFVANLIEMSLMNSKHVSNLKGISAILSLGPMKVMVNSRQIQDFFLFREIWLPRDAFGQESKPLAPTIGPHPIMVQRYQQVAAASPFPWSATVSIASLDVELDLGSSLGKGAFHISKLWTSSRKLSNWEQNLCLGFDEVIVESNGRLSCYIGLQNMRLRTSIKWPQTSEVSTRTPLIQASIGFQDLLLKAAFEYQTFLVATFSALDFLMYNVRDEGSSYSDRLVCTVEGDQVQAYCTTQSSAQVLALYQSFQRLIQEKKQAYENSLKDIRRYYRTGGGRMQLLETNTISPTQTLNESSSDRTPLQLQTNVVVSLKYINVGVYPRSLVDSTIFKLNALDASARFSVLVKDQRVHSSLGLSLGQVRVALSPINRQPGSNAFEDISVDGVVQYSMGSRGGTILKVPRVVALMETWQKLHSTEIEYIFRSTFEGKVEVGWNINRINVIRSMWNSHSNSLASRLGKALPQSAVQITGVPTAEADVQGSQREKITAVVNVPLSKYSYKSKEPPIIETPQLRDMGEATPPLEWIGLHRDRLPNITHQIIIVPLLEVAKEVEDAYSRILGAS